MTEGTPTTILLGTYTYNCAKPVKLAFVFYNHETHARFTHYGFIVVRFYDSSTAYLLTEYILHDCWDTTYRDQPSPTRVLDTIIIIISSNSSTIIYNDISLEV